MDEPTTFEQLIAPDELTLRFTPLGLATGQRVMSPEGKLEHLRNTIANAELVPDVPEEVRQHFARFRKLFLYGVVEYDFFTLVEDLLHLQLEAAFRHRFISYYEGRIPIFVEDKVEATLLASSFHDVRAAAKLKYKLNEDQRPVQFPRSLTAFFRWARTHWLLVGQRSQMLYAGLAESRNRAAHPVEYSINMPVGVGRTVADIAEIINKLWGSDTPGGRLFPRPIARTPRVIAVPPGGGSPVEFPTILNIREDDPDYRDWIYTVYLAAEAEKLIVMRSHRPQPSHRPGFQTTEYPCDVLWGPGSRTDLLGELDWLETNEACDAVEYLDRVFVIRADGERPDDARSPDQFIGSTERTGHWFVIRADHPLDAWNHVRNHRDQPIRAKHKQCAECPVTEIGRFKSRAATAANLRQLTGRLETTGGAR